MNFWQKLWRGGRPTERSHEEDFDPDVLLEQAQQQMQEVYRRNRERAVQAITQKNNLQQMVDDLQKKTDTLRVKLDRVAEQGEGAEEDVERLRQEHATSEQSLTEIRASLQRAVEVAEQVKTAIRQEEERIRFKTAEALALQAQWKTAQVQRSLLASLVEINAGIRDDVPPSERVMRHARNRRLVQQAIVQRNHLRSMRDDTERRVGLIRGNAQVARERGNDTLENQLLREMEQYEATLAGTRDAVHRAEEVTERAINLLQSEAEDLRALGLDPLAVTEEQVVLFETQTALADVENEGAARRIRRRQVLWVTAVAFSLLCLVLALTL